MAYHSFIETFVDVILIDVLFLSSRFAVDVFTAPANRPTTLSGFDDSHRLKFEQNIIQSKVVDLLNAREFVNSSSPQLLSSVGL